MSQNESVKKNLLATDPIANQIKPGFRLANQHALGAQTLLVRATVSESKKRSKQTNKQTRATGPRANQIKPGFRLANQHAPGAQALLVRATVSESTVSVILGT